MPRTYELVDGAPDDVSVDARHLNDGEPVDSFPFETNDPALGGLLDEVEILEGSGEYDRDEDDEPEPEAPVATLPASVNTDPTAPEPAEPESDDDPFGGSN